MLKVAIFSPSKNSYSESFIQAHRNLPEAEVLFFHDGQYPTALEGKPLVPPKKRSFFQRLLTYVARKLGKKIFIPATPLEYFLSKNKVDVVLAEYGWTGLTVLNTCKRLGLPLVVHFHGNDAASYTYTANSGARYHPLFQEASAFIAVSRVMEKMLLEYTCPPDKLYYNVYGPHSRFLDLLRNTETINVQTFLAIGRFVPKKAPHKTLFAFAQALKVFPHAKLIFIGGGELLHVCKDIAKQLGIYESVYFKGIVPHEKVQAYMKTALAFVQHSVRAEDGDMEGTPVAILEAMAAGLPIISTRHAGIMDVVLEGETGLLCDEHDVAHMAKNMCTLLANPSKAFTMGQAGRKRVQKHYTQERHLKKLREILAKSTVHE